MSGDLMAQIRRAAQQSGLDALGVTDASPFGEARKAIEDRKAAGLHAGMWFTYGRPERSTTPGLILQGARSIVVCVRRYSPPAESAQASNGTPVGLRGAVAAYVAADAYGELCEGLRMIREVLLRNGHRAEALHDDNRLVDRAAAARAGLGWLGRNSMLLSEELGSWTVLGSVVTTAELPCSAGPLPDGCGTCRRCEAACPTGALDDGVLDANRCLAWLLQADGPFPEEHRAALGDRIYGCDDCQTSCPVNDAPLAGEPSRGFVQRASWVDLVEMLAMTDDELMGTFGHWYIARRQPMYLRRNALVVLGNVGDGAEPAVVDALRSALASGSPVVASHAEWAAKRLGREDLIAEATAMAGAVAGAMAG